MLLYPAPHRAPGVAQADGDKLKQKVPVVISEGGKQGYGTNLGSRLSSTTSKLCGFGKPT